MTYKTDVVYRGNCVSCGKPLTKGLFLCEECKKKEDELCENRRYAFRKKY